MAKNLALCILFAFAVLFLGCAKEETEGSIEGTVTLEHATDYSRVKVYLSGTAFTAITQSDGSFQMLDVHADAYQIIVEKEGFISVEQEVEVKAGQVTTVEFVLEREIPMPPSLPNP